MAVNGYKDLESQIFTKLSNQWTQTDIAWPNTEFDPTTASNYIQPIVNVVDEKPVAIEGSNQLYRIRGDFTIAIYTEIGQGTGKSADLADSLASTFRGLDLNGDIQFRGSVASIAGETNDGSWLRRNLRVDFDADLRQ